QATTHNHETTVRGALFLGSGAGSRLATAQIPIEPGDRDAVGRQRLGDLGLGGRQGELGVGQLDDVGDAGVDAALAQTEVFVGRLYALFRGANGLLRLLDGDVRLLHLLPARELGVAHAGLRGVALGLGLVVQR